MCLKWNIHKRIQNLGFLRTAEDFAEVCLNDIVFQITIQFK